MVQAIQVLRFHLLEIEKVSDLDWSSLSAEVTRSGLKWKSIQNCHMLYTWRGGKWLPGWNLYSVIWKKVWLSLLSTQSWTSIFLDSIQSINLRIQFNPIWLFTTYIQSDP